MTRVVAATLQLHLQSTFQLVDVDVDVVDDIASMHIHIRYKLAHITSNIYCPISCYSH